MTKHRTGDTQRGSVTVFFAVAAIGLFAMVGLVVDGGTKVKAIQRADRVAAEAARAAGQAIDVPTAIVGDVPVVRPGRRSRRRPGVPECVRTAGQRDRSGRRPETPASGPPPTSRPSSWASSAFTD